MEKNYNKRIDNKPAKQTKHRINEFIKVPEVRVVGDNIENSGDVMRIDKALKMAYDMGLDLVETSPNAVPPIVKKLKEMNKKQKENNKPLKEVQFSPHIGVADIETKTKHIKEFILENHKVKVVMKFKQGREIQNSYDKGELVLYELLKNLEDIAKPEALPKLTGKTMIVTLNPKK